MNGGFAPVAIGTKIKVITPLKFSLPGRGVASLLGLEGTITAAEGTHPVAYFLGTPIEFRPGYQAELQGMKEPAVLERYMFIPINDPGLDKEFQQEEELENAPESTSNA